MTTIEQIKDALQTHIAEAEAATPGPWDVNSRYVGRMADATFLAHARTMSPAACKCLLLAIEGLESDASYIEKIMHPCDMFANGVEAGKGCFVDQAIRRLESIRQEWHNLTTK